MIEAELQEYDMSVQEQRITYGHQHLRDEDNRPIKHYINNIRAIHISGEEILKATITIVGLMDQQHLWGKNRANII